MRPAALLQDHEHFVTGLRRGQSLLLPKLAREGDPRGVPAGTGVEQGRCSGVKG